MEPLLDELIINSWQADVTTIADGWVQRVAALPSWRINAVFASGGEPASFEWRIAVAEAFYRSMGKPVQFLVSEASAPHGFAGELARRDYTAGPPTLILRADAPFRPPAPAATFGLEVEITDEPSEEWIGTEWSLEYGPKSSPARLADFASVVGRTPGECAYAIVRRDARPVSLAQLVVSEGWGGIQCVVTDPTVRRTGLATVVLRALVARADALGAHGLFLAVMADNLGAIELYRRFGFEVDHAYRYWSKPIIDGGVDGAPPPRGELRRATSPGEDGP